MREEGESKRNEQMKDRRTLLQEYEMLLYQHGTSFSLDVAPVGEVHARRKRCYPEGQHSRNGCLPRGLMNVGLVVVWSLGGSNTFFVSQSVHQCVSVENLTIQWREGTATDAAKLLKAKGNNLKQGGAEGKQVRRGHKQGKSAGKGNAMDWSRCVKLGSFEV